jgi:hypothetical protein
MKQLKNLLIGLAAGLLGYLLGRRAVRGSTGVTDFQQTSPSMHCCGQGSIQEPIHDHRESLSAENQLEDTTGALFPKLLRDRISETFSSGYMTLLAIIQGVALGGLVTTLYNRIFEDHIGQATRLYDANIAIQALGVLIAIVIVTDQYFLFVQQVRWVPIILDTGAPYAMGVGEVGAALFLGKNPYWWASVTILLFAAAIAFGYTYVRVTPQVFGVMREVYPRFVRSVALQALLSFVAAILSLLAVFVSLPNSSVASNLHLGSQRVLPIWTGVIILGAMLIKVSSFGERKVYAKYGIERFSMRVAVKKRWHDRWPR